MKRKVRTITVNQQKFVWWYSIGEHETVVKLSPLADKTSVINVVFGDIEESLYGEYNESVVISRGSVPQCGLFQCCSPILQSRMICLKREKILH